jgi:hypothetical protein
MVEQHPSIEMSEEAAKEVVECARYAVCQPQRLRGRQDFSTLSTRDKCVPWHARLKVTAGVLRFGFVLLPT